MRHRITLSALWPVLSALSLFGCSTGDQSAPANGPRLVTSDGSGPCPHPLLPLVEGARWRYKLGDPSAESQRDAELRVLKVTTKGTSVSASVRRTVGASVTTAEAVCDETGTSFLSLFVPLGPPLPVSLNFAPTITKREGALLLPLSKLRSGAEWTSKLVAHTERPGGKALTLDSTWDVAASYIGQENVKVGAGRYDVEQVKLVVTGHHSPPAEEDVVFTERLMDPPPMTFTYSLARGVGVVLVEGHPTEEGGPRRAVRWELVSVDRAR